MSRGKETGIFIGIALAFAVLVFAALLLLGSSAEQAKAVAWVSQTRDTIEKIDQLVDSLTDAENARRGFVIAGEDRYLAHHASAVTRAREALLELRTLSRDNPTQAAACDEMEKLIATRLGISTNSIQARRERGLDPAEQTRFIEQGQQAMEPIRTIANLMVAEEKTRLEERVKAQDKNIEGGKGFAVVVSLGALVLFTILLTLFVLANRQRRRAEDALQKSNRELEQRVVEVRERSAQLEAAVRELESFSYSISHDLRAPLRHIHGYVEMLKHDMDGKLDDKASRYLRTIAGASIEMGQLIDDLLAFSRMGRTDLRMATVNPRPLVDEVINGLELAIQGRNIIWKIGDLPPVAGDPATLRQVFANLVGNAVKYTRNRETAEIEIGVRGERDGMPVFFVADNGAGFDMQYANKLFGVFQRLHTASEFEGTGIGLATVRRIIQRHGGQTWAEGAVDKGATIYFTLKPAAVAMA